MERETAKRKISRRTLLKGGAFLAAASTIPIGAASTDWLYLDRRTLRLPNWGADGFRVAFLSDFHLYSSRAADLTQRAVAMLSGERFDTILLGGDFVDNRGGDEQLPNVRAALAGLADYGVPIHAVWGNHDYGHHPPIEILRDVLNAMKIDVMRNNSVEIQGVTIVGLDDAMSGNPNHKRLDACPPGKPLIAMIHEPDRVASMPSHVGLQLSGHSHGGQICMPGGIPFHNTDMAKHYVAGFYPSARVPLFVSRGIGTTGPRLRTYCRPEVHLLTLRAA